MLTVTVTPTPAVLVGAGIVTVALQVRDSDPAITRVSATVDWGDGSSRVSYASAANPLNATLTHAYGPGEFVIRVVAVNYRAPRPDTVTTSAGVSVKAPVGASPVDTGKSSVLRGPSFPTGGAWNWDTALDGAAIKADLDFLLNTTRGERLGDPEFGTNLTRLVFEPNDDALAQVARHDIATAVARYVPLATLVTISWTRGSDGKSLTITATFTTDLTAIPLIINLSLPATPS